MRLPITTAVLLAVLLVAGLSGNAHAVRLGPVDVSPYVSTTVTYDDNVFVRNINKTDDVYFQVSPGIMIQRVKGDNLLQAGYRADIYRYIDTGELNDVEDHSINAAAHLNTDGRLWLRLDDMANRGHEPRGEAVVAAQTLTRYYSNDLSAVVGYELTPKFGVSLAYTNYYADYFNSNAAIAVDYRDRVDNGVELTVKYRVTPKTKALVQGAFKDIYHTDNVDPRAAALNSREYWTLAGLTWDITGKSTGTVKAGYEWKKFKDAGMKDFATPVYIVSLNHRFTPKTSLTVTGTRRANETDDPDTQYYTTTNGALQMNFKPTGKIDIGPYVSYNNNRYHGATTISAGPPVVAARRIEDIYTYGLNLGYNMNKWIALKLGYNHDKKVSTIKTFDYTRNTVSFTVSAAL